MKALQLIFFIFVITLTACTIKPKEASENAGPIVDSSAEKIDSSSSYMPVAAFVQEDIRHVDSFYAGILKKTTRDGKKDSGYIQNADFHSFAQLFLDKALDSSNFRQTFTETPLFDTTTKEMDFIYNAKTDSQTLRKVIVYVKPSVYGDKVDRIYMEKKFSKGDTAVDQKLNWRMKHYFYILTMLQPKAGKPVMKVEKVIWEPQDFKNE
jgi:hypothetical protein